MFKNQPILCVTFFHESRNCDTHRDPDESSGSSYEGRACDRVPCNYKPDDKGAQVQDLMGLLGLLGWLATTRYDFIAVSFCCWRKFKRKMEKHVVARHFYENH